MATGGGRTSVEGDPCGLTTAGEFEILGSPAPNELVAGATTAPEEVTARTPDGEAVIPAGEEPTTDGEGVTEAAAVPVPVTVAAEVAVPVAEAAEVAVPVTVGADDPVLVTEDTAEGELVTDGTDEPV